MALMKVVRSEKAISRLREENMHLRQENEFLKSYPTLVTGIKGETLIAKLTGGYLTEYATKHDVTLKNQVKIEVKYSNHREITNSNQRPKPHRWAWNKPEGHHNRGKDYDFLLLVGNKDYRFTEDYLDSSPFIYILIPVAVVKKINSKTVRGRSQGGTLNLNTDIATVKEGFERGLSSKLRQMVIVAHMVPVWVVSDLEKHVRPALTRRKRMVRPALISRRRGAE